jgi:hypothetical protein
VAGSRKATGPAIGTTLPGAPAGTQAGGTKTPPVLPLEPGWREERLLDDNNEEILIRYKGEASPERYAFIRDYLDFKLARLKPKASESVSDVARQPAHDLSENKPGGPERVRG